MARLTLKQFGLVYHSITQYVKYRFNRRFPEGSGKYALFFATGTKVANIYNVIAKLRGITVQAELLANKQLCIDFYAPESRYPNPKDVLVEGLPVFGKGTTGIEHMELEIYDTEDEAKAAKSKITSSLQKWVEIKEI